MHGAMGANAERPGAPAAADGACTSSSGQRPDSAGGGLQHPAAGRAVVFARVPLRKRVHAYIERSEAGITLDSLSAALSLLTVFTYMVRRVARVQRTQHTHHAVLGVT